MKTRSILSNSSLEVLAAKEGKTGTFQVKWIEELDQHVLLFIRKESGLVLTLAAHHNGHSCNELTKRILAGDIKKAEEQMDYIVRCGGLACSKTVLEPDNLVN